MYTLLSVLETVLGGWVSNIVAIFFRKEGQRCLTLSLNMAKDFYHNNVKLALEKDGWVITHDPYKIMVEDVGYEIDFGAEPLLAAEKEGQKIAVEVKSFMGPSTINEFHKAVGQFNDYYVALSIRDPFRVLFWAIPISVWIRFFQKVVIQKSLERI